MPRLVGGEESRPCNNIYITRKPRPVGEELHFVRSETLEQEVTSYAKTGKRTGVGKKEEEKREAEETESQGSSGTTRSNREGTREEKAEEDCTERGP